MSHSTLHSTLARLKIISLSIDYYTLLSVVLTHLHSRFIVVLLQFVQVHNNFPLRILTMECMATPIMLFIFYFLGISDFQIYGTTRAYTHDDRESFTPGGVLHTLGRNDGGGGGGVTPTQDRL